MYDKYKRLSAFVVGLIFILGVVAAAQPDKKEKNKKYIPHKPLEYEVSVRAQILPVFAVNEKNEPVYDLKRQDLELSVNGQPHKIAMFTRFKFIDHKKREHVIKQPERINFIIIDSVLNTKKGLKRSLAIARMVVEKASPGEAFVIFESNKLTGFQYVIGPDKDKTRLLGAIDGIMPNHLKRRVQFERFPNHLPPGEKEIMFAIDMWIMENRNRSGHRMEYRQDIQRFSHSLGQLKYALKTLTKPKAVFLISAGLESSTLVISKYRFLEKSTLGIGKSRYYEFLQEAAKAINYGGSMLYIINPLESRSKRSLDNLKFMADKSGGKYFINTDIKKLVTEIKKSTAAYYEVAFFPSKDTDDKISIQLKSRRKGITLYTINYSEKGKPYKEMDETQKKLFALNVVFKGSWSRIVGQVAKIRYRELEDQNKQTPKGNIQDVKTVELNFPPFLVDQTVDLFLVEVNPTNFKSEIDMQRRVLKKKTKIEIPVKKNRDHYFVIVEPGRTYCIYNQVTKIPVPQETPAPHAKPEVKKQKGQSTH